MIYSTEVSTVPTEAQERKFLNSVVSPPPSDIQFEAEIIRRVSNYKRPKENRNFKALPFERSLNSTRVPLIVRTCPEQDITTWVKDNADDGFYRKAVARYPELFAPQIQYTQVYTKSRPNFDRKPRVGNISYIQEPGYKLRAVANPNRLLQSALIPLQKEIMRHLSDNPKDCTTDQYRGVEDVFSWLKAGSKVHSIDLSDATNNFPLSLQLGILRTRLNSSWTDSINLFEFCSKGDWKLPKGDFISWTKGQPLGLAPSFASFAYSHHMVVRVCRDMLKQKGIVEENDYRILGDDIVIKGDALAATYLKALYFLGCPVSKDKTITSDRLAEFAGKTITPHGVIETPKWKLPSDRSFISFARTLGPKSIALLRPRQRKIVKILAEVPEVIGGMGWNPKGKPLAERLNSEASQLMLNPKEPTFLNAERTRFDEILVSQSNFRTSLNTVINGTQSGSARTSSPSVQTADVLERIQKFHHYLNGSFEEGKIPKDLYIVNNIQDPRGVPLLDVLENRLKSVRKRKLSNTVKDNSGPGKS